MEYSKVQFKCEVLLKMEILQIREMRNLKKKTYVFDVEFKKTIFLVLLIKDHVTLIYICRLEI